MVKFSRGFTLVELLIVIVILGILTAVAYPSYRDYVDRGKRPEAKAALLQIATNQERHYLQNNTFTTDMTKLGFSTASNYETGSGAYIVDVTSADATGYEAIATFQGDGNEADKCKTFEINAAGEKTSAPYDDCWTGAAR